jgi:hypothetical protein
MATAHRVDQQKADFNIGRSQELRQASGKYWPYVSFSSDGSR